MINSSMNFIFKKYLIIWVFWFLLILQNKSQVGDERKIHLTRKNFARAQRYLQLKKNKADQKIDPMSILNLDQEKNNEKIPVNSQIPSIFMNNIMIDFLPGLLYMPFLTELFTVIIQKSDEFLQNEIKKLLDIIFLGTCKKMMRDIGSMNLDNAIIITNKTYEKLSQQYHYSFKDLKNLKEMPFVLATNPMNFLEIKQIAFGESGFKEIKQVLNHMLENNQILSSDKLNREFVFLPRPAKNREDFVMSITKDAAQRLAQQIWILFTTNDRFILELILGYLLFMWAEVDKSVKKNIESYLGEHVKEKNKIKMIYKDMIHAYKNNIICLDKLLKNISSQADAKELFSFQVAIETKMKQIYIAKKKKQLNNIKDKLKIAGKIIGGAALFGAAMYFYNPTMVAKGISWVTAKSTIGLQSILPSIKGWWNNSDSLNIGISSLIFSPWQKLAQIIEKKVQEGQIDLIDKKLFGQTDIADSRSLLHNMTREFTSMYITKNIMQWGMIAMGLTPDKFNLNILSKIKSKMSEVIFNQNIYYLFELGKVFDRTLESTMIAYLFENSLLSLNVGISELIKDRRQNNIVTQQLKKGYDIFESGILKTFGK